MPQTPIAAKTRSAVRVYLKCPTCQAVMNRCNFGRISGIVIDVCRGHGIWFDAGEISAVLRFVTSGGLNNPRAHQMSFAVPDGVPKGEFIQGDKLTSYDGLVGMFSDALAMLWEN